MIHTKAYFIATTMGVLSLGALAQDNGSAGGGFDTPQVQTFTELDANNDGVLDRNEVQQANANLNFNVVDANGDSEVDRNEYYQYQRDQR